MRILKVSLLQCKPGDVVAQPIVDIKTGVVLCPKGYVITKESISWLLKFNCSDIYIKESSWNSVWRLDDTLTKVYEASTEKLSNLLSDIGQNKPINTKCIDEISTDFFETLNTNSTIMGCINKIKSIDEYTYMHCMNVGMLATLIGKWLKLPSDKIEKLFLAGILMDIGKYKLKPELLNKPGALTNEEYTKVQKHILYSHELIKDMEGIDDEILQGVLFHHERLNGSGYPKGLQGADIPLFGKILAVADTYDAMTSDRVYKRRQTPFAVMEYLTKEGYDKFDTNILLTFLKNIADYYIGVYVKLNTGQVGEVVFIHPTCIYKPIVRVNDGYVDLNTLRHVYISEVL